MPFFPCLGNASILSIKKHLIYLHNEHPQNPQDCSTATPGIPPPIRYLPSGPFLPFRTPTMLPASNPLSPAPALPCSQRAHRGSSGDRGLRCIKHCTKSAESPGVWPASSPTAWHPEASPQASHLLPTRHRPQASEAASSPPPPPSFSVLQAPTHHPRPASSRPPAPRSRGLHPPLPGPPPDGPQLPRVRPPPPRSPPPARRPLPSPALPGPGLPGRAFTAGWRRGARSPTAGGGGSDLPTGPARRARGRGENFCCGSSSDSSHPCAFLLFLPLLLLLFLLLFLLPEQSRGRHGAARAPPRSPPLPARCIVGSPAHRKRSGPPALAWRGDLAARPSVALIPAPACQSRSVTGEAGSASRLPVMGLEGRCFEVDWSRESS